MWTRTKTAALAGSGVGLALFLWIGLLPALVYGGYAGLLLAGGIYGTPVPPGLLPSALIVFGMILGVLGTAALFAVAGAAAGSAAAHVFLRAAVTRTPAERAAPAPGAAHRE